MKVVCPNCGQRAQFELPTGSVGIEIPDGVTFVAPEGFRKVQGDWRCAQIQLYCCRCGVPSVVDTGTH